MQDIIRVEKDDYNKRAVFYTENLRTITSDKVIELRRIYKLANFKIEIKRESVIKWLFRINI